MTATNFSRRFRVAIAFSSIVWQTENRDGVEEWRRRRHRDEGKLLPRSSVPYPPIVVWTVQYDSCLSQFLNFLRWNPPWKSGTGIQAVTDLETVINQGVRFYVFGASKSSGLRTSRCTRPTWV